MKYKAENSKIPLQQNKQRHKQRLAKYMPSFSNNSNQSIFSCPEKPVYFFSPQRGKSLGTRLSFVSHRRITTIGYG
jgi:hypothetical protein